VITSGITFIIDSGYFECNEVAKLINCNGGQIYLVSTPLLYIGNQINKNKIIKALINGVQTCVTYSEDISASSTDFISNIIEVYTACTDCVILESPTPTPSVEITPTITNTPTQSSPNINTSFVYSGCGTNQMVIQNTMVMNVSEGQAFEYGNMCWSYIGQFNNPYIPPSGFIVNTYDYNYFGTISLENIHVSCSRCLLNI